MENHILLWTLVGITASVLTITALIWLVLASRKPTEDRIVEQIIKSVCDDYVRNVVMSDGLYGYYFIDYLVLLRGKILILGTEHLNGYLFGSEQVQEWAQVLNNQSKNFNNPLLMMDTYTQAIQTAIKGIDIVDRIVFTSNCTFPKGTPQGVLRLNNLQNELERLRNTDADVEIARTHWNSLVDLTNEHKQQFLKEGR